MARQITASNASRTILITGSPRSRDPRSLGGRGRRGRRGFYQPAPRNILIAVILHGIEIVGGGSPPGDGHTLAGLRVLDLGGAGRQVANSPQLHSLIIA